MWRESLVAWLLVAMIVWSLFAVGGVYVWAAAPLIAGSVLLAVLAPPKPGSSPETRTLDVLLMASVGACLLQLVPLPPLVRTAVSPNADRIDAAVRLRPIDAAAPWQPISVAPLSTAYAIALVLTALVFFWSARRCCARGMTHRIVRQVAFAGLMAALVAIALQARSDGTLIYGRWHAIDAGAHPFGPFVNRNHFATWVLMACPLAAGYVSSTFGHRRSSPGGRAPMVAAAVEWLGTSGAWVGAAGLVMILALVVSTSRSGLVGLVAALTGAAYLARHRLTSRTAAASIVAVIAVVLFVVAYANVRPLMSRLGGTLIGDTEEGRTRIWRETTRVARDFPLTGTGLGSYQTTMLTYQRTGRDRFINQAHNQYLQLLAEGGLLLAVPLALTVIAFIRLFLTRLAQDTSSSAWLRIGGGAAILAVAVQSIWETGLRIPANGLLFAAAAAVAVHRPPRGSERL